MKTKKGMASLYLVAFTTLLLGVVTMSFTSIMINERKEASNSDLSQSAFDSALAGIEDAKTAILMYEACSGTNAPTEITTIDPTSNKTTRQCRDIREAMDAGLRNNDCDTVRKVLSGNNDEVGEVTVSEDLNQYYTCVPISEDSPYYQSTLTENTRSRVINAGDKIVANGSAGYADVVGIELQWYTPETELGLDPNLKYMQGVIGNDGNLSIRPLGTKNEAISSYPVLNFELFQTDTNYTMAELDLNNPNNTGTDHAMITLYPDQSATVINNDTSPDGKGTFVSAEDLLNASNKSNQAAQQAQDSSVVPKAVSCEYQNGAHCRATIQFPATYQGNESSYQNSKSNHPRAQSTFLLRVSLPYGNPETDFSIKPCTAMNDQGACTSWANFSGAQYIVDSTGRASTLYRRIIARVETSSNSIFPEYAIQTSGNNPMIEKNFWVTENCWTTDGKGNSTKCANNGNASTAFPQGE